MKTDDLISVIVQDRMTRRPSMATRLSAALAIGGAVAATMFAFGLGVRPDIGSALQTWRFLLKVAVALTCFACALWASERLARPEANVRQTLIGLAILPALLAIAVACELMMVSPVQWYARAVGSNARICLVAVPLLSAAPLAAILAALRAGAPRSPPMAGAVAGVLAGALGATLYAVHCPDDSPLFVAIWYSLAVTVVMLVGASVGRSVLRW